MSVCRHLNLFFSISLLTLVGCGAKQFGPQGRELMNPLQTAISAKNLTWVDATEQQIAEQADEGTLSDFEVELLNSIVEDCREGNWKRANSKLQGLIDGQRATSEDVAQLREGDGRRPSEEHRKRARGPKG